MTGAGQHVAAGPA
jgi:hypothetical protein